MSEETKNTEVKETKTETTETKAEKKPFLTEARLEVITAIFLGLTALLTSWGSWIGSLHGGNQSTNYTESNNYSSLGNAEWNEAAQRLMQDMMAWNEIQGLRIDYSFAEENGEYDELEKLDYKLEQLIGDNCSEELQDAIIWSDEMTEETGEMYSPFDMDGFVESYFEEAQEYLAMSDEFLEQGKQDNANGDAFNLATVIYSVVLFLLGVVGIFKNMPNRAVVLGVAIVAFLVATIYMFTIPMPTGFNFASYFGA